MLDYRMKEDEPKLYYPTLVKFEGGKFGVRLRRHWWSEARYLIINYLSLFEIRNSLVKYDDNNNLQRSAIHDYCSGTALEVRGALAAYIRARDEDKEPFKTIIGRIK